MLLAASLLRVVVIAALVSALLLFKFSGLIREFFKNGP
jgi:hypothetical protein